MVASTTYKQLTARVHWRAAASMIARCLGDDRLADEFRDCRTKHCSEALFWAMQGLLAGCPAPQPLDEAGHCACGTNVNYYWPLLSAKALRLLNRLGRSWAARSPADLGFVNGVVEGCVLHWLSHVSICAFGSHKATRPGLAGRPGSELYLRGALRLLVAKIEAARRPRRQDGVVSPATCASLLLFFQTFANGSRGRNPALPRIVQRDGVATGQSLRALAHKIEDLTRYQPKPLPGAASSTHIVPRMPRASEGEARSQKPEAQRIVWITLSQFHAAPSPPRRGP